MKVINKAKVPIKSWCNNPESGAIDQAVALANLPFIFKQVCLMPDTHQGYGMPIGGVIGTEGVVIPNAVGVDIGCGMMAVGTNIKSDNLMQEELKMIMTKIRERIPMGFKKHKESQQKYGMPNIIPMVDQGLERGFKSICEREYSNACMSLGTLGGGNHFIEIQKDQFGLVWIMLHSGSRNLGKQICDHYNKLAIELNKKWHNYTIDLGFLPLDTKEGQHYLKDMNYALKFAQANRDLMMKRCMESFEEIYSEDIIWNAPINIHHNYATMEHHFGKNVMIHRKGATRARDGELGIIPGSQGTSSYIVRGLGNPDSFMSCSHGAGRKMSRVKARKNLDLDEEKKILDNKGIIHSIRGKQDLDEAPSAYKDIQVVMEEQRDLVEIVTKLEPLAVIKA